MSSQASPLLELPFEIRGAIWKLAKPESRDIYLTKESASSLYHDGGHYSARLFDTPSLFLVNRQIYAETRPLHKRKVTLVIVDAQLDETYVGRMGYIKRNLVTNFIFYGSKRDASWPELMRWDIQLHSYYKKVFMREALEIGDNESTDRAIIIGKAKVMEAIEDSDDPGKLTSLRTRRSYLRDPVELSDYIRQHLRTCTNKEYQQ